MLHLKTNADSLIELHTFNMIHLVRQSIQKFMHTQVQM